MIKRLIEIAKEKSKYQQTNSKYLNINYKSIITSRVKLIKIDKIHANILLQMYRLGILNELEHSVIRRIEKFVNSETDDYYFTSFFGTLYLKNPNVSQLILAYIESFYDSLKQELESNNLSDDLIYYDVDRIICKNLNSIILDKINSLNIKFEVVDVEYIWIDRIKKYIYLVDGEFSMRGFEKEFIEIRNNILNQRRQDRLEILT